MIGQATVVQRCCIDGPQHRKVVRHKSNSTLLSRKKPEAPDIRAASAVMETPQLNHSTEFSAPELRLQNSEQHVVRRPLHGRARGEDLREPVGAGGAGRPIWSLMSRPVIWLLIHVFHGNNSEDC